MGLPSDPQWEKFRKWWSRRSSLEQKLTMLLIIAAIIIFIFIVVLLSKFAAPPAQCKTSDCLIAASEIISSVDPTINPCDDFFKFVCGNTIKFSPIKITTDQVESQLDEIMQEPVQETDHYLVKAEKELYKTCMAESGQKSLTTFKDDLQEIDNWPVVVGLYWRPRMFHWTHLVYSLRKKGYAYSMLLPVTIEPDSKNNDEFLVHIKEPSIAKFANQIKEKYLQYMIDVAIMFGAERNRAENEMERVLRFMDELTTLTERKTWNSQNDTIMNYTRRFRVDLIQEYTYDINWLDYINEILYPSAQISSRDYVVFPSHVFVDQFFALLRRTPKRIQANYIIWKVVEDIIPFLPKQFAELDKDYMHLTNNMGLDENSRFQLCKLAIKRSFFVPPSEVIYARRYLPLENKLKIEEMLNGIKKQFIKLLKENDWMDQDSIERTIKKATNLKYIIGIPGNYTDETLFEKFTAPGREEQQNNDFLKVLLDRVKCKTDAMYAQLAENVSNGESDWVFQTIAESYPIYKLQSNTLILPVGTLQGFFYNTERPMYLNYAILGSIIGHELTHSLSKIGSDFDSDGNSNNIWTDETMKAYDEQTTCILKKSKDVKNTTEEDSIQDSIQLEENVADITGVKVAYAAYQSWIRRNSKEPHLVGVSYTPHQLFWISSVLPYCNELHKAIQFTNDEHDPIIFGAIEAIQNNHEFGEDFRCRAGSKMNPVEKCEIF